MVTWTSLGGPHGVKAEQLRVNHGYDYGCNYEVISTHKSLTKRARHQCLLRQFTKQWKHEYLTSLREFQNYEGERTAYRIW